MNLRKSFSHHFKSKCHISNFLMKKFKYLDLPQYLFIKIISYCCKQKFVYRFFNINMTRNISETNVINCYWMKLCNMVKILTSLVFCVNVHLPCHRVQRSIRGDCYVKRGVSVSERLICEHGKGPTI